MIILSAWCSIDIFIAKITFCLFCRFIHVILLEVLCFISGSIVWEGYFQMVDFILGRRGNSRLYISNWMSYIVCLMFYILFSYHGCIHTLCIFLVSLMSLLLNVWVSILFQDLTICILEMLSSCCPVVFLFFVCSYLIMNYVKNLALPILLLHFRQKKVILII